MKIHCSTNIVINPLMNKKKSVNKMIFEPKVPVQKIEEVEPNEIPIIQENNLVKGKFPPIQLQSIINNYKYSPNDKIIINIPYNVSNADFLIFEDDTCGLRINNQIIRLDAIEVENDSIVSFDDGQCCKVCDVSYYLIPKDVII